MNSGLEELRRFVPDAATVVPDVSKWSVGMHIQHCGLAMSVVCPSLVAAQAPAPRSRFNPVRSVIFLTGRIPRGRGKSPAQAVPTEGVQAGELEPLLDECEVWLERVRGVPADHWYEHFAFGILDRDRTLKFIRIHNGHHLRIIQDILRA